MARAKTAAQRRAQNAGVKPGTVRMGAAGKGLRRYNAMTGRWDKFSYGSRSGASARIPGAGKDGVNAATSSGPAWTSNNQKKTGAATFSGSSISPTNKKTYKPPYKARQQSLWDRDPLASTSRAVFNQLFYGGRR